jgi:hypothetical protein
VEMVVDMDLKVIKLVSGETIFAEVEVVKDSKEPLLSLRNPMGLAQGPQGTILQSWPPFATADVVEMRPIHAITITDVTNEQIINGYNKLTGGITTPEKPALLVP